MRSTLFHIPVPETIGGWPFLGAGVLLAVWLAFSACLLAWLIRRQGFNADTRTYLPLIVIVALLIWLVLPALVEPGGIPIRGYGVMVLLGIGAGLWLLSYRARRAGMDHDLTISMAVWMIVAGLAGARLFYVVEYWEHFRRPTLGQSVAAMVNLTQGGLVVYGALLAGLGVGWVFVVRHGLPVLAMADVAAPSLALGLAFGRVGCFLNGCCYGGESDLPWAVQFPARSPPYLQQVQTGRLYGFELASTLSAPPRVERVQPGSAAARGGLRKGDVLASVEGQPVGSVEEARRLLMQHYDDPPRLLLRRESGKRYSWTLPRPPAKSLHVHPVQLYSAIDALVLTAFLLAWDPYRRRQGELLAWMLTIHPISRYLQEVIRVDEASMFGTGLSISQLISLGLLLAGVALWWYLLRQPAAEMVVSKVSAAAPRS
jgi:phosphatidylglycerol:prolipoprotein diacylglycerol transferase